MLEITLSGSKNDVLKAATVLGLVFEGVQEGVKIKNGDHRYLELTAQELPGNSLLLTILEQVEQAASAAAVSVKV